MSILHILNLNDQNKNYLFNFHLNNEELAFIDNSRFNILHSGSISRKKWPMYVTLELTLVSPPPGPGGHMTNLINENDQRL